MIYLDYSATSLKRKDIVEEIFKNIEKYDGNPESLHAYGRESRKHLEEARDKIAESIGAKSHNIVFTSGASEANNTIIKNFDHKDYKIISSKIEHPSILEPLKRVESGVVLIDCERDGRVNVEKIIESIDEDTKLVCLMYVNNETGVIQDVEKLGAVLKEKNIWFHVDAVQAFCHIDIDVEKIHCDSLSLSGHKIGGLNGFGILYVREKIESLIYGGDQEHKRRAGTSFTMGAVSMAKSIEPCRGEQEKISDIKRYFLEQLKKSGIEYEINGEKSVNHIVNVFFPKYKSDFLLMYMDMRNISLSAGSACTAGNIEPSHVITDMYDEERARHSVRFSFGFTNTREEIDRIMVILKGLRG